MLRKNVIFAETFVETRCEKDRQIKMGKTKYMQADEAFFKLLRLGIGTCHDRDVALDIAGWAAVYDMACKQAVAAIVLDGVERLSIIQKPPMDVVMPWIGLVQQIETRIHSLRNRQELAYPYQSNCTPCLV